MIIVRGHDSWGAGHFTAKRGSGIHSAIDVVCNPGEMIRCFKSGIVTKLGWAYADDSRFRYVEVTTPSKERWRYFYVAPWVFVDIPVCVGRVLGNSQAKILDERYPEITPHFHLEIIDKNGNYINPTSYLEERA